MKYSIYYRGQNINTVEAKTNKAAMKRHLLEFSLGALGTTIAIGETESREVHLNALECSKTVPGTKVL